MLLMLHTSVYLKDKAVPCTVEGSRHLQKGRAAMFLHLGVEGWRQRCRNGSSSSSMGTHKQCLALNLGPQSLL